MTEYYLTAEDAALPPATGRQTVKQRLDAHIRQYVTNFTLKKGYANRWMIALPDQASEAAFIVAFPYAVRWERKALMRITNGSV